MSDILERTRRHPGSDWTIRDVEVLCRSAGIACVAPRGGGSHYKVSHPLMAEILTIPFKRPIKPVYIRRLVGFVDAVRRAEERDT